MSYVIDIVSLWIITSMIAGVIYESLLGFGDGKHVALIVGIQSFFQASISIGLAFVRIWGACSDTRSCNRLFPGGY